MNLLTEYLKKAINGESSASQKYAEFAEISKKEGYNNISYLFKALSEAEKIHIKNHTNALNEDYNGEIEDYLKGTTKENVKDAIDAELWENKKMYPAYIKAIKKSKNQELKKVVQLSFEWARDVEYTHYQALKLAMKYLEQGKDLDCSEIYVCSVCGNLIFSKPTKICPICGHDPSFYIKIKKTEEN